MSGVRVGDRRKKPSLNLKIKFLLSSIRPVNTLIFPG